MKALLLYATSQGQTRRIMHHLAARLESQGNEVALVEARAGTELEIADFDACILAASVHAGRYQPALVATAKQHAQALSARPGLFLSVSLTAAGNDPEDWTELDRLAQGFLAETGWVGPRVAHVAGALRFSEYGFFEYWAMLWISRRKNREVSGKEDVEFTDWGALDALLDEWSAAVCAGR
jgi:menaquinone-dependent protoporphyrinogen oxidase